MEERRGRCAQPPLIRDTAPPDKVGCGCDSELVDTTLARRAAVCFRRDQDKARLDARTYNARPQLLSGLLHIHVQLVCIGYF
jgi:hypothetical protein